MNIQGNEAADAEAGLGSKGVPPHSHPDINLSLPPNPPPNNQVNTVTLYPENHRLPTLSHVRATNRKLRQHKVDEYWARNQPVSYKEWELPWRGHPKELSLTRTTLHRLLAERSGHGDFDPYHWRFGHPERAKKCKCGADRTPGHAMNCPLVAAKLRENIPGNEDPAKWILGEKGFRDFEWMVKTLNPYAAPDSDTATPAALNSDPTLTASLLRSQPQGPSES
ncbi:hypothetical protein PG994_003593 [Apiospora phragmitis]|uniref:Uncharacterized protein n=1 Tax=Apiospora phragmitis TaxID=2905665 RepID=A0ABR1VYI4_9PEZI